MTDTAGSNPPVMPPGRELDADAFDAEIALKVMGWTRTPGTPHVYADANGICHFRPDFLHSWDAMRLVVERLVALRYDVESIVDDEGASVIVAPRVEGRDGRGTAATLPHATCLAALAALKAVEAPNA